jgi:hypothetical protein
MKKLFISISLYLFSFNVTAADVSCMIFDVYNSCEIFWKSEKPSTCTKLLFSGGEHLGNDLWRDKNDPKSLYWFEVETLVNETKKGGKNVQTLIKNCKTSKIIF